MHANMKLTQAIDAINYSIIGQLKETIEKKLMETAKKVVEEAAEELCINLKAHLIHYDSVEEGNIVIKLMINDKEKKV